MMSISPGIHTVDELIAALERYRDDPPLPNEPIDEFGEESRDEWH